MQQVAARRRGRAGAARGPLAAGPEAPLDTQNSPQQESLKRRKSRRASVDVLELLAGRSALDSAPSAPQGPSPRTPGSARLRAATFAGTSSRWCHCRKPQDIRIQAAGLCAIRSCPEHQHRHDPGFTLNPKPLPACFPGIASTHVREAKIIYTCRYLSSSSRAFWRNSLESQDARFSAVARRRLRWRLIQVLVIPVLKPNRSQSLKAWIVMTQDTRLGRAARRHSRRNLLKVSLNSPSQASKDWMVRVYPKP